MKTYVEREALIAYLEEMSDGDILGLFDRYTLSSVIRRVKKFQSADIAIAAWCEQCEHATKGPNGLIEMSGGMCCYGCGRESSEDMEENDLKTPLTWKIRSFFGSIIRRLSNHYYGCCSDLFKNCDKCRYVIADKKRMDQEYYDYINEMDGLIAYEK